MDGGRGDLAELGKNATRIMIFLPHYMWIINMRKIKTGSLPVGFHEKSYPFIHYYKLRLYIVKNGI